MKNAVIDARESIPLRGRHGKAVDELCSVICKYQLTYAEYVQYSKEARERTQLQRPKDKATVKPVPSMDDVAKFLNVVERQSVKDALMIKILLYMGIRSIELVRIKVDDLDLTPGQERIFVHRKGGRDKWFVIPAKLAPLLRMYMELAKDNVYLFESGYGKDKFRHKPYDCRSIRNLIQKYREEAGIGDIIHAHNFRHLLLTTLAAQGWSDSELMLISGHDSRTSLDRYIYQNPEKIRKQINESLSSSMAGV